MLYSCMLQSRRLARDRTFAQVLCRQGCPRVTDGALPLRRRDPLDVAQQEPHQVQHVRRLLGDLPARQAPCRVYQPPMHPQT